MARIAEAILRAFGQGVEIDDIEVAAPLDIGMFLAMCLASQSTSWRERRRAIAIGVCALVIVEILTVVLSIALTLAATSAATLGGRDVSAVGEIMATIPWVAAVLAWLPLLGGRELRVSVRSPSGRMERGKQARSNLPRASERPT
ncbi:MAG TPA: hypothetical protein VL332_01995 [Candidatus Saccharimonadaceae bacterium]|nr:hypothetical protein [Candidatus Saccharimonadaceae bacterium]